MTFDEDIDTLRFPMQEGCVFCEIAADRSRSKVCIQELSGKVTVVAFEPLNPVTPGHTLFIPVAHHATASQVPHCMLGDVFGAAAAWAKGRPYNLITSAGASASQTVFHMHVHLVPRAAGDGLALPWTDTHKLDLSVAERYLKDRQADSANGSRDFGRGYALAIATLRYGVSGR